MAVMGVSRGRTLLLAAVLAAPALFLGESCAQVHSNAETGSGIKDKVQRLLSDSRAEDTDVVRRVFGLGREAVPTLVEDLRKGLYLERASRALMYLGGSESRRALRELIATEKDPVGPQVDPDQDAASTGYGLFCGTLCAPNSGGLPSYNPVPWNDPRHIHTNNCYSYACDRLHPPGPRGKPQPGEWMGYSPGLGCIDLINAARMDGAVPDPFRTAIP